MKNSPVYNLIIIGSGPAALTAAIYSSRANLNPLIIEGTSPGGQLISTTYVENWPGEKKILGPELMKKLTEHAKSYNPEFISETVTEVDFSKKPYTVFTDKKKELKTNSIIIATGASPKKLNCPGEKEYWAKGVSVCAVCDGAFYKDMPVIIIGGGDTAMEEAHFMTKFTNDITIIQLLDNLTASKAMQEKVLNNKKIKILYNKKVIEIKGDGKQVTDVLINDTKTNKSETIKAKGVFIAIGISPNSQIFKDQLELNSSGYIVLKEYSQTSIEGIFAAGDVADSRYRQAISAAGMGCCAALDAEKYLSK